MGGVTCKSFDVFLVLLPVPELAARRELFLQSLLFARNGANTVESSVSHADAHDVAARTSFSEVEECLWLRVFGAVERHATPCRAEPRQGPTSPHLVPLDKAVAAIEEIFGGERTPPAVTSPQPSNAAGGRSVTLNIYATKSMLSGKLF